MIFGLKGTENLSIGPNLRPRKAEIYFSWMKFSRIRWQRMQCAFLPVSDGRIPVSIEINSRFPETGIWLRGHANVRAVGLQSADFVPKLRKFPIFSR